MHNNGVKLCSQISARLRDVPEKCQQWPIPRHYQPHPGYHFHFYLKIQINYQWKCHCNIVIFWRSLQRRIRTLILFTAIEHLSQSEMKIFPLMLTSDKSWFYYIETFFFGFSAIWFKTTPGLREIIPSKKLKISLGVPANIWNKQIYKQTDWQISF